MKITIKSLPGDKSEIFEFELFDGPNDIEHVKGYSTDLINAFTKILEWHERIRADYSEL